MILAAAYVIGITGALGLICFLAEPALSSKGLARRWLWAGALVGSILLPVAASLAWQLSQNRSGPIADANAHTLLVPGDEPSTFERSTAALRQSIPSAHHDFAPDAVFAWLWLGSSITIALLFSAVAAIVLQAARHWPYREIDGVSVRVSERIGPAVIGFFNPEIVVPRWVLTTARRQRRLVLAHERQHISAGDPCLLLGASLLVALMPWNVSLWWMLRRLRFAIEVDCDARVVAASADRRRYAAALLTVAKSRISLRPGLLGVIGSASELERRIRCIVDEGASTQRSLSPLNAAMGVLFIAALLELQPPPIQSLIAFDLAAAHSPAQRSLDAATVVAWSSDGKAGETIRVRGTADAALTEAEGQPALVDLRARSPGSAPGAQAAMEQISVIAPAEHGYLTIAPQSSADESLKSFGTQGRDIRQYVVIPAGDGADAMNEISRQFGQSVVYRLDDMKGRLVRGVEGYYNLREALSLLLLDTGLTFVVAPQRDWIVIRELRSTPVARELRGLGRMAIRRTSADLLQLLPSSASALVRGVTDEQLRPQTGRSASRVRPAWQCSSGPRC
jgi:hypothetical protein